MKKKTTNPIRPEKSIADLRKLLKAYRDLLDAFELVFHVDWKETRSRIGDDCFISPSGTFIEPGFADESDNWATRGGLLSCYRTLKTMLGEIRKKG
jgi:hypothetical protein